MLPEIIEQDSAEPNLAGKIESTEDVDALGTVNGVDLDTQDSSYLVGVKAATDESLGDLLSQLERLRYRAIDRWGGQPYLDAVDVYKQGDQAYISRDYLLAGDRYRQVCIRDRSSGEWNAETVF